MPDSPAVKLWRDKMRYNTSLGRKHDIDATITDLELWDFVLSQWGYFKRGKWVKFNPLNIAAQLSEYERLERLRSSQSALAYTKSER